MSRASGAVNVELSVPSESFTLGQTFGEQEGVCVDLARFVPIGDQFVPYVRVETDDPAAFERCARTDGRVTGLTALDSTECRTLYRIEWEDPDDEIMSGIATHGLVIEDAMGTCDRWWFRLRAPDHEDLTAFQQELVDEEISPRIHRIWRPSEVVGDPYELTALQRETLELAYEEGYFDVPRTTSLGDLGEMLGVSHQSVSRRIRVGLENLLAATLMRDGALADR